ncbi:MAG: hypothetical protein ACYDC5_06035 [Candidatus Dormibacteria bacterium]
MPERGLELDPEHIALVVIDLQQGIVGMPALIGEVGEPTAEEFAQVEAAVRSIRIGAGVRPGL